MHNASSFVLSLSQLVRWLAKYAEESDIEFYPGLSASEELYDYKGRVCDVATGDVSVNKDENPGGNF